MTYGEDLLELLLSRCTEVDSGARTIDNILNASLLPALATQILVGLAAQKVPQQIAIHVKDDEMIYQIDPPIKSSKKQPKKTKALEA